MVKRTRKESKVEARENKRLCLSIDTLIRGKLGLPIDATLNEAQPVPTVECLAFLYSIANQQLHTCVSIGLRRGFLSGTAQFHG